MLTIASLRDILEAQPGGAQVVVTAVFHQESMVHEVVNWEWREGDLHLEVVLERRYKHRLHWLIGD
jgi:hypothetical protein